jgi:hypothetical protein
LEGGRLHACLSLFSAGDLPMSHKKPGPVSMPGVRAPKICPVCGSSSYSRDGIHPQCAQQQADAPRIAKIKAKKKSDQAEAAAKTA